MVEFMLSKFSGIGGLLYILFHSEDLREVLGLCILIDSIFAR